MWIIMALLSALLAATRRTNEKKLTHHIHHLTMGRAVQLFSLPVTGCTMLLFGRWYNPLHLGLNFWLPLVAVSMGFYPLNSFFYYKAIQHGELSKVLPLQSLWPVFSVIPAIILLHEVPSALSLFGILVTVLGVYILGLKGKALHHPLKPFMEDRSSLYILCAVVLVTLAGILDKIAIRASDATYYSFMSTVGAVLALSTTMAVRRVKDVPLRPHLSELGLIGMLQGGSYTTYLIAMSFGPVAYVSAVRSSNVLIGALLGIMLLKEKFTLNKKIAFACIAFGSILLAIGS